MKVLLQAAGPPRNLERRYARHAQKRGSGDEQQTHILGPLSPSPPTLFNGSKKKKKKIEDFRKSAEIHTQNGEKVSK